MTHLQGFEVMGHSLEVGDETLRQDETGHCKVGVSAYAKALGWPKELESYCDKNPGMEGVSSSS